MTISLASPVRFPEDDAQIIRRAARLVLCPRASEALDLVKDMIGHPGNVQQIVRVWGDAAGFMKESFNDISQAQSQVATRWSGGAYLAFQAYAGDVKTIISSNALALQKIATETANIYKAIMESYSQAVTFISKCAQTILNFGGGLLSDWKSIVGVAGAPATGGASTTLVMKHYTDLLNGMADNITNLINDTIKTISAYNFASMQIMSEGRGFIPVPVPAGGFFDLGAWKPS